MILALALGAPAAASASHRRHRGPAPSSLHTIDACLRYEAFQWIEESGPHGESYCERIGPHKEHPVTVWIEVLP